MKKISYYILAALSIAALASCTKELLLEEEPVNPAAEQIRTFILDLGATKTTISEAGKTQWAKGDTVILTDGTNIEKIAVPDTSDGQAVAEITTREITGDTVYAVYPQQALASTILTDGKINLVIPTDQGGDFADANIMVGKADDYKFAMKNAAAVLKIHVETGIEKVVFNASGDALSGNLAVEFADDKSIQSVTATGTTGIVTLNAMGGDADFYVAVAPGTYKAGFNMLALDDKGQFESKSTTKDNTLTWNNISDLGTIGAAENLKGFSGEGTEADPYLITNLGEMLAFSNTVNIGTTYEDKYLKVTADLDGITLPAGYYDGASDEDICFKGSFDGDNHTITVDLDGAKCKSANSVALFGDVEGAEIKNVKVAGKITTEGSYVAGIAGLVYGDSENPTVISNCTSSVEITGKSYVGGIIGYGKATDNVGIRVENCTNTGNITSETNYIGGIAGYLNSGNVTDTQNSGAVSGNANVGGIVGYCYGDTLRTVANTGAITAKAEALDCYQLSSNYWRICMFDGSSATTSTSNLFLGAGGLAGYAQNTGIEDSNNSGTVNAVSKASGILGVSYGSTIKNCVNTADITASGNEAGGILAYIYNQANVMNCTNSGAIKANVAAGGIIGYADLKGWSSSNAVSNIQGNTNNGDITTYGQATFNAYGNQKYADYSCAGGIIGGLADNAVTSSRKGIAQILNSTNNGSVTAPSFGAGGIIGYVHHFYTNANSSYLEKSVNTGAVTAKARVGGIIGAMIGRFVNSSSLQVRDSENSGTITATNESAASSAGGILGWSWYPSTTSSGNNMGPRVYNALNTGAINYATASYDNPYVGGIFGYASVGICQNAYNSGKIGPASGTAVEDAIKSTGAIGGYAGTYMTANYVYHLDGTALTALGTSSVEGHLGTAASATTDGASLLSTVTAYTAENSTDLLAVLNAWSTNYASYNYYMWGAGPKFVKE